MCADACGAGIRIYWGRHDQELRQNSSPWCVFEIILVSPNAYAHPSPEGGQCYKLLVSKTAANLAGTAAPRVVLQVPKMPRPTKPPIRPIAIEGHRSFPAALWSRFFRYI